MKRIITLFAALTCSMNVFSQSNDCATATVLTPGATCVNTAGTTAGATQSIPGCVGTADDDVWYQFTATGTSHQITVTASVGFDPVVQLFSGTCATLSTLACMDNGLTGDNETIYATGLTNGQTYRIRVYHYYSGAPTTSTFSICVTNPPAAPSNNTCGGATALTVNTTCSATSGTTLGATQSSVGCAGTADDDVFFSFVATNSVQTITVNPSATMDAVVELYSGSCASLTSIQCQDVGFTDGNEVINAVGLTPGTTYYVRVYDYYASTGGAPFTICVTGAATSAPSNDEPCSAISIPVVTSACNYLSFTSVGATTTATPGAPSATCVNWDNGTSSYGAPGTGGFGAGTRDVWFAITVPATGNITITNEPGLSSPTNDMVFVLYSGACGSLSQIACSDDYNYPGSANDLQPFLNQSLTPGQVVYLRVYCYGTTNSGVFGFCVTTNTNDACANALYICDLNGYSASTSAAFTPDRPGSGAGQMFANNETAAGVNQTDGINTGGPFGQAPSFNASGGSPLFDVNIENNSWIRFTAASTTATLNVAVTRCFVGNYPSGGIQMQIFSATACNNFVPVSNFQENSTGFTITAQGLTVGQDYYLMVDGYARDICNYTISANSGVQFPDIVASANPICAGASTLLTAPAGATAYEWYPGSPTVTTQTISVNPSTTTTYTCIVSGVCGQRQTLTKTITVNQLPAMTSSASPAAICSGATLAVGLTSNITSTYSWLAGSNANVGGESTSATVSNTINNTLTSSVGTVETVTYTVTPTATSSGCVGTPQIVSVIVNPRPTIAAVSSQTVCAGSSTSLITFSTSNPASSTVNWTNGATSIGLAASGTNVTSIPAFTTNTVTAQVTANIAATVVAPAGVGGCTGNTANFTIVVNPTPQFSSAIPAVTACGGSTVSAINFVSSNPAAGGVNWTNTNTNAGTGGVGITAASGTGTISAYTAPLVTATQTTSITATPFTNSCSGNPQSFILTINPRPTLAAVPSQTVCAGNATSAINFGIGNPLSSTVNWTNNTPSIGLAGSGTGVTSIPAFTTNTVVSTTTVSISATVVAPAGSGGCTGNTTNFNIVVNPTPQITSTQSNQTVCGGGTVNFGFVSSPSGGTVNWTNTNTGVGIPLTGSGNTSYASPLVVATQTAQVTAIPSIASCSGNPQTFTITINPTPTFTLSSGATQTVCGGANTAAVVFSATPAGSTINWTNSNTNSGINGVGITSGSGTGNIASYVTPLVTATQTTTINASVSTAFCAGTSSQSFNINVNPTPVISAVANTTVCGNTLVNAVNFTSSPVTSVNWTSSGTNTGLGQLSGSGSVPSFTSANVTTLATSTVTLNTTLGSCPAQQVTYTITVNPVPALTVTPLQTQSGCGVSTGALTGATVNGSGSLNYNWTNSSNVTVGSAANLTNVPAGSYNLTVTDANCTATFGPFNITSPGAPAQPTIASASGTTLCVGDALSLTASSTETNPSFVWSGPNATSNSNALTVPAVGLSDAGTYTVTITLPNNCTSNQTVNVVVNVNPSPSATSSAAVYCSGSQIDLFGSGGTGYQWTGPNSYSSSSQNPSLTNSTIGMTGTYTLTVTNAAGCDATTTTSITINETPPVPTASATDVTLCEGENLQLNASSTGATTYNWNGPNAFNSAQQNPALNGVTVSQAGVYIVDASIGNCTSATATVTVAINTNPIITASALASTVCSGSTIDLSSSGGGSYSWSGPASYTSLQQNPSIISSTTGMSGTYTLTVTDANSCSALDSVAIIVNATPALPVITASATALCEGDDLQLNASSTDALTYTWLGPNSYSSSQQNPLLTNVTVSQSGTYTVSASANNCTSPTETITVVINAIPVVTANPASTTACSGSTVSLTGTGGGAYAWSGPNAFSSTGANPQLNNSTVQMTGTYTLTVTTNGCSATDSVLVLVNPTPGLPVITASGTALCEGDNLQLNANSTDALAYNWTGPNGFSSSVQNPSVIATTINNSGTYTVTATANGCTGLSETVAITINATPVANASVSANLVCSGNTITLTANGGTSFNWTGPNGFTSGQQNNTLANIDVTASGTYTYTAVNAGNCTDTATVDIVIAQTPSPAVTTGSSTCNGTPVVLTANGTGTISWYSDATLGTLVSNDDTLYPNLSVNTSAVYYVTVSGNGCTSSAVAVNASNYNVNAAFSPDVISGYAPLAVNFTNQSTGVDVNDSYNWLVGTSSYATSYNSSYTFTQGGSYNITLIITDSPSGCMDTASVTVVVDDEIKIIIPNVFTPNGDGTNDAFTIDMKGVKEAEGTIYNRWGQLLFQWDAVNVSWDGKVSNGESVADGIYFYIIKVVGFNGDKMNIPGNVTIVR